MNIKTKFNINEPVYIKPLKIWGKILSLTYCDRLEYYVRYFDKYDPRNIHFLEEELSNNENNEKIGF